MADNIVTARAPAASNYAASAGLAVAQTAVVAGEARVTLLAASDDGNQANTPFGFIVDADNVNGGAVSVARPGSRCKAFAGAAITPGTDSLLMIDATSRCIPVTDGNFVAAQYESKFVAAAGDIIDVLVLSQNFENT